MTSMPAEDGAQSCSVADAPGTPGSLDLHKANEILSRIEGDTEQGKTARILSEIALDRRVLQLLIGQERVGTLAAEILKGLSPRPRQKQAIVDALIAKYGNPRAILAAALGVEASDFCAVEAPSEAQIQEARTEKYTQYAISRGAEPLKGTEKQRIWGENIRANLFKQLTDAELALVLRRKGAGHARFWIDARFDSVEQLLEADSEDTHGSQPTMR